jgi:hypothetical protein
MSLATTIAMVTVGYYGYWISKGTEVDTCIIIIVITTTIIIEDNLQPFATINFIKIIYGKIWARGSVVG